MTRFTSIGGLIAATSISFSGAAWADVSAQAVWDDWKSYMEAFGYTVNGTATQSGNVLTIDGMNAVFPIPENEGTVSLDYGTIIFTENDDGSVALTMPAEMDMKVTSMPASDEFTLGLKIAQTGMTMIATGDDAETTYDFVAPEIKISISEFVGDGMPLPAILDGVFTGYRGHFVRTEGEAASFSGDASMDSMSVDFDLSVPEEEVLIDISLTMADLAAAFTGVIPDEFNPENMAANFASGFAIDVDYSFGEMVADFNAAGDGETFALDASAESAALDLELNGETLALNEVAKGVDVTFSGSSIPFPEVNVAAGEYGFNFQMPTSKSDDPQDIAAGIRIVDLAVTDMIWGMFDPTAVLPRDPATVIVDLTGQANWLANIMDPEEMMMMGADGPPGELHQLSLNDLQVKMVGVEASGAGAFTFDNTDLETYEGLPRPEGSVEVAVNGANGLLDKIVAMGFIPEDQAMGMRMMLGLFAVPGEGEDSLTSTIEVNEEGHLLANGQRLK